jgi:hypothetical protein
LREERRLRVFENRVQKGIFVPERDMVTGEWRKVHSEELNDLHCSPDMIRVMISRRMRWAGHVARMVEMASTFMVLVGRPEGERLLRRPKGK